MGGGDSCWAELGMKDRSPGLDQPAEWAQQKQGLSRESSPRWHSSPRQPLPPRGLAQDTGTKSPTPCFLLSLSTMGAHLPAVRRYLESRGAEQVCGLCIYLHRCYTHVCVACACMGAWAYV